MAFFLSPLHSPLAFLIFVVHLLVIARAITRPNRVPASRVAWVAVITFLPLLGVIAYLFLGETSIGRERIKRLRNTEARMPLPSDAGLANGAIDVRVRPLFDLAQSINGFKPETGNRIVLLGDPAATPEQPKADSNAAIDALVADIEQAREHVHIGFYIWLDDHNGGRVVDAMCAAARRDVQCRVMVDALGSRAFVHGLRWRQLRDAGVRVHAMLDDVPRLGHLAIGRVDLRNHRKVAVIDNRIAYCGSQNCADPEFRVKPKFAPWIDLLLRREGPVVRQAQYLFLSAWISETSEALEAIVTASPEPERFEDGVIAQMFGTGPTTRHNAMSDMFVAAMYAARDELLVTTPYFVPDEALLRALCAAPRRGVKTTIVFPARNDSMLVGNSCRSTWADLLDCGVNVLEYPLGILHSKSMTIDGEIALVGSANMDRRSLELNYENNLVVADRMLTQAIRKRQLGYMSVSRTVGIETVRAWPYHQRLLQNAIGMMAPVL
ncbi:cardiolipin synthase [Thermomonas sp. HDW16]|uniref:cardiolipin synthase n=1 Tax=Thermomonas sp. HDW16 TaxID=2714945 RepID=UPI00140DCA19|nr:cardiolipin synthase [Thermomonas sp. HDW16]QIL20622.1 cardiolipin synthase [Thermomonas sp. HDW16]